MQNNWYVITGAPSSGKTTLINFLESKGICVVHEAARRYIDQEIKKGRTIRQIRSSEINFQHEILKIKIDDEQKANKKNLIFFDRAIPDSLAYYKLWGVSADSFLQRSLSKCSYKKVFLLKAHAFLKDYARVESEEQAKQLELLLEDAYQSLNISIIKVPVMSVEDRAEFILNEINIKY